jgi:hypothetical protein
MKSLLLGLVLVATSAACEDVPMPYDLDHARVMAVRVEPPALAAGERARIDVLVTDAAGGPRVADAGTFTIRSPIPLAITREPDGWVVQAPSETDLAMARTTLGLAPDADVIAPLELAIDSDEGELRATKTVALGTRAANPPAPAILQDGEPAPRVMTDAADVVLTVDAADPALSYRWFSSVGDVTGYTRAEATLEPIAGTRGHLGVVVRDQAGGTAWVLVPAEVAQ